MCASSGNISISMSHDLQFQGKVQRFNCHRYKTKKKIK